MMTQEELKFIRARCEAATPGPWVDRMLGPYAKPGMRRVMEGRKAGPTAHGEVARTHRDGGVHTSCTTGKWETERVNALFIAHARTDVPALLDEVERLRSLVAALEAAP